jgi:hypothetical protein
MADPTLLDLVKNGTMNSDTAATLWTIAQERRSFMVVAVPRFAGKSTVTKAMLAFVPQGVPMHYLSGDEAEMEQLRQHPDDGYLVVGEFSKAPVPTYIWGSPVRKVFETLRAGFSLTTALHAPSVEEAYVAVCQGNEVADEDASRISYMLYIERMGTDLDNFWRRIARVYEVDRVVGGVPQARLLHSWAEDGDRFERVEEPRMLSSSASVLQDRARRIQQAVDAGRTTESDVAALSAG